ncbi:MAG: hypothetical protein AB7S26_01200 [Sandaracinaceae bacterium]
MRITTLLNGRPADSDLRRRVEERLRNGVGGRSAAVDSLVVALAGSVDDSLSIVAQLTLGDGRPLSVSTTGRGLVPLLDFAAARLNAAIERAQLGWPVGPTQ